MWKKEKKKQSKWTVHRKELLHIYRFSWNRDFFSLLPGFFSKYLANLMCHMWTASYVFVHNRYLQNQYMFLYNAELQLRIISSIDYCNLLIIFTANWYKFSQQMAENSKENAHTQFQSIKLYFQDVFLSKQSKTSVNSDIKQRKIEAGKKWPMFGIFSLINDFDCCWYIY